jgi:photosystem II stability/assembly factor-like uncharacterized protein
MKSNLQIRFVRSMFIAMTLSLPQAAMANPVLPTGTWVSVGPSLSWGGDIFTAGLAVNPVDPSIIYLCVSFYNASTQKYAGLWKTTDAGSTWQKVGKIVSGPKCSDTIDEPIQIRIDPQNPQHLWAADGVRGCSGGLWESNDGGNTFSMPPAFSAKADNSVGGWTIDAYDVEIDPADSKHVLVAFHSGFENSGHAGVLETKDGGQTFIRHYPIPGVNGAGHGIFFLSNPALGVGNGNTWLLETQGDGSFRTTDGGNTWAPVTTNNLEHGGGQIYYTQAGVLYSGGYPHPMRSTDNGATWTTLIPNQNAGYLCIIGDGTTLFTGVHAQVAPPGGRAILTSPESDGLNWTNYNNQLFAGGAFSLALDRTNHILYSASTTDGLWALQLPGSATVGPARSSVAKTFTAVTGKRSVVSFTNRILISRYAAGDNRGVISFDVKGRAYRQTR